MLLISTRHVFAVPTRAKRVGRAVGQRAHQRLVLWGHLPASRPERGLPTYFPSTWFERSLSLCAAPRRVDGASPRSILNRSRQQRPSKPNAIPNCHSPPAAPRCDRAQRRGTTVPMPNRDPGLTADSSAGSGARSCPQAKKISGLAASKTSEAHDLLDFRARRFRPINGRSQALASNDGLDRRRHLLVSSKSVENRMLVVF